LGWFLEDEEVLVAAGIVRDVDGVSRAHDVILRIE
jgi:hypothetical protein